MKKLIAWLLTAATLLLSLTPLSLTAMAEESGISAQAESIDRLNATSIDLYLIGGQSNASGTSKITDREGAYELAPELESGFPNIFYAGKPTRTSSYDFTWENVRLGMGKDKNHLGPEAGMAIALSEYYNPTTGKVAGILKYAHGGSKLSGNDDDPDSTTDANWVSPSYAAANGWNYGTLPTGGHYAEFLHVFREKVNALVALGYTEINLKGLYWMQGEGDRLDKQDEYERALSYLIQDLRKDLSAIMKEIYNKTDDGGAENLPIFVGAISESYLLNLSNRQGMNQKIIRAQKQVVANTDNCYFIDNSKYKISAYDAVNNTAIALGSDTGHWSQTDMLAIGQTVGEEMYQLGVQVPAQYADVDSYPFLLLGDGAVINAAATWKSISNLAKTALTNATGSTVTVLLRKDHTIKNAPSTEDRICFMNGTLVVNLGGYTLTTNNTFLGTAVPNSYTGSFDTACYVKNGTVAVGSGAAFLAQNTGTQDKKMSVVFENVTFEAADTFNRSQLFHSNKDSSSAGKFDLSLTLNNCTLDLTKITSGFTLFSINQSRSYAKIAVNGGNIKATSLDNITLSKLHSTQDTLVFGKCPAGGDYTTLTLPTNVALPTWSVTLDTNKSATFGGTGVASGETLTYSLLSPETTAYGTIPVEYTDKEAYPFALFVDGSFYATATSWVTAFNAAQEYLSANVGKTVNVLMRRDQTSSSGITHLGRVMGQIVWDLGTHSFTRTNHSAIEVATNGMTEEESKVSAGITVKNGTFLANGRLLTYQVFNDFDKTMNVIFDSVTVKIINESINPVVATSYNPKNSGKGVITSTLTFKNCKFDFTETAPTAASYLFNLGTGASSHKVDIILDGGSIEGNVTNVMLSKLGKNDSLLFTNSGNGYTVYVTETAAPTGAIATDAGEGYFYKDTTLGAYVLGIGRAKLTGASVSLGSNLSILYYVKIHDESLLNGDLSMTFTMNGKTVTVTAYEIVDGEYVFRFDGIAPQQMADLVDAKFFVGDLEILAHEGYSVLKNCESLLSMSAAELGMTDSKYAAMQTLIADLVAYGKAAQDYKDYDANGEIAIEGVTPSENLPTESDAMTVTGNTDATLHFTSATVRFDTVNSIVIKIFADVEDASLVTVRINGVDYKLTDLTDLGNGTYKLSTEGIKATNFDTVYTVELLYNGESVATLGYSVNAYAYAMSNGATQNAEMKVLAETLYRYGASADNYNNAQ